MEDFFFSRPYSHMAFSNCAHSEEKASEMKFFFPFFLHKGPRLNRWSRDLPSFLRSFFSVGANFSFTARSLYLRSSFATHCYAFFARLPRATGAAPTEAAYTGPAGLHVFVCVCV